MAKMDSLYRERRRGRSDNAQSVLIGMHSATRAIHAPSAPEKLRSRPQTLSEMSAGILIGSRCWSEGVLSGGYGGVCCWDPDGSFGSFLSSPRRRTNRAVALLCQSAKALEQVMEMYDRDPRG